MRPDPGTQTLGTRRDGGRIVWTSIRVWDIATGRTLREFGGTPGGWPLLAALDGGGALAAGLDEGLLSFSRPHSCSCRESLCVQRMAVMNDRVPSYAHRPSPRGSSGAPAAGGRAATLLFRRVHYVFKKITM
jgi:hypothetical protein